MLAWKKGEKLDLKNKGFFTVTFFIVQEIDM